MRNKYGARKTVCQHGHKHASAKEARRCVELHILQHDGEIIGLEVEPAFYFIINGREVKHENGRRACYKPDFVYIEKGVKIAEDCKGGDATKTEASVLRMTLARHLWPEIRWVTI